MTRAFTYRGSAAHIVFGAGKRAETGAWLEKLGCSNAIVLSTPHQERDAARLSDQLGSLSAGVFAKATMHTPVDVTDEAMEAVKSAGADCIVSLGGG
ncbi:iron-containing alcohol dehydrogenase, partial [Labrenzia sp. R4_2]|uniref:iron-containing alcohol dehydrogenase n=1 Tax=Labrenzia sp. R4_2 TaxID=2821107 RepID=UPI001ADD42CD